VTDHLIVNRQSSTATQENSQRSSEQKIQEQQKKSERKSQVQPAKRLKHHLPDLEK